MVLELGQNIWIVDGPTVRFFGFPFSTRMVVVRLPSEKLWVYSPVKLSKPLKNELEGFGEVKYVIAPNRLHHLFLSEWVEVYKNAKIYATEGLIKKRRDLSFYDSLKNDKDYPWTLEIDHLLFSGSFAMEECVGFHKSSKTLIVADLVENFSPQDLSPLQRLIARGAGCLAPNGKMPLDWRLTFIFKKKEALSNFEKLIEYNPKNLVMSHGVIITKDATTFLKNSFIVVA